MWRKPGWAMGRSLVLLAVVAALVATGGCGNRCKEQELRIVQMDQQLGDLQAQVAQKEATIAEANALAEELRAGLAAAQGERDSLVSRLEEEIVIELPDELLFAANSDVILDAMAPTLRAIGETIKQKPGWMVYVQGHTDQKGVPEEFDYKWTSGWDVAAARACAVVRYMTTTLELPPAQFACVSYGNNRPKPADPDPKVKVNQRRVTFLLHKMEHERGTPVD